MPISDHSKTSSATPTQSRLSSPPKTSLQVRIVSAVIAVVVLFTLVFTAKEWGMRLLCIATVVLGTRELMRILFLPEDSKMVKTLFYLLMLTVFGLTVWAPQHAGIVFAFVSIFFFSASIWFRHRFNDLGSLTHFQAKSILGFFYLGLLPGFACLILELNHGLIWFIAMLAFVFSGDIVAFFAGTYFGKNLLLPEISPKKTVEGALGGLFGSLLAGAVLVALFPILPWSPVMALAGLAGLVGQMGDLFESLLKRVANQKDSGTLMPGHGGLLDRLDGVLFAAPIVYIGATLIENGMR